MKTRNNILKTLLIGTVALTSATALSYSLIGARDIISSSTNLNDNLEFSVENTPENTNTFFKPTGLNVGNDYISFSVAMKTTEGESGRDIKTVLDNPNNNRINISIDKLTDDGIYLDQSENIYAKEFTNPTSYVKSYNGSELTAEQSYFVPMYDFMITNDDIMGATVDNSSTYDNPLSSEDDLLLVVDHEIPFTPTFNGVDIEPGTVFSAGADPLMDESYYNNEMDIKPTEGFVGGEKYELTISPEADGQIIHPISTTFAPSYANEGLFINQDYSQMKTLFPGYGYADILSKGGVKIDYNSTTPIDYTPGDSITIKSGLGDYDSITSDISFDGSELTSTKDASTYDKNELFGTFNPKDGYKSSNISGYEANFINTKSNNEYNVLTRDRYREVTNISSNVLKPIEFTKSGGMTSYTPDVSIGAFEDFIQERTLAVETSATSAYDSFSYTMKLPSLYYDYTDGSDKYIGDIYNPESTSISGVQEGWFVNPENSGYYVNESSDDVNKIYRGASLFFYSPAQDRIDYKGYADFQRYWSNVWSFHKDGKEPIEIGDFTFKEANANGDLISGGISYGTSQTIWASVSSLPAEGRPDSPAVYYEIDEAVGRNSPVYGVHFSHSGQWTDIWKSFIVSGETFPSIDKSTLVDAPIESYSVENYMTFSNRTNQLGYRGISEYDFIINKVEPNTDGTAVNLEVDLTRLEGDFYDTIYPQVIYQDESSNSIEEVSDAEFFGRYEDGTAFALIDLSTKDVNSDGQYIHSSGRLIESEYIGRQSVVDITDPNLDAGSETFAVTDRYTLKNIPVGEDVIIGTFGSTSKYARSFHNRGSMSYLNYYISKYKNELDDTQKSYYGKGEDYYFNSYEKRVNKDWYLPFYFFKDIEPISGTEVYNIGGTSASIIFEAKLNFESFDPIDITDPAYIDDIYNPPYVESEYKLLNNDNLILELTPTAGGATIVGNVTTTPIGKSVGGNGITTVENQRVQIDVTGLEENTEYDYNLKYISSFTNKNIVKTGKITTPEDVLLRFDNTTIDPIEEEPSAVRVSTKIVPDDGSTTSFDAGNVTAEFDGFIEGVSGAQLESYDSSTDVYTYKIYGLEGDRYYTYDNANQIKLKVVNTETILPDVRTSKKFIGDTPMITNFSFDNSLSTGTSITVDYSYEFKSNAPENRYFYLEHNKTNVTEIQINKVTQITDGVSVIDEELDSFEPNWRPTQDASGSVVIGGLKPKEEYEIRLTIVYEVRGKEYKDDGSFVYQDGQEREVYSPVITVKTSAWGFGDINWGMFIIITILITFVIGMIIVAILYYRTHH